MMVTAATGTQDGIFHPGIPEGFAGKAREKGRIQGSNLGEMRKDKHHHWEQYYSQKGANGTSKFILERVFLLVGCRHGVGLW